MRTWVCVLHSYVHVSHPVASIIQQRESSRKHAHVTPVMSSTAAAARCQLGCSLPAWHAYATCMHACGVGWQGHTSTCAGDNITILKLWAALLYLSATPRPSQSNMHMERAYVECNHSEHPQASQRWVGSRLGDVRQVRLSQAGVTAVHPRAKLTRGSMRERGNFEDLWMQDIHTK